MSPDTDAVEAPATDEARELVRDAFTAELGDAIVESHIAVGRGLWLRVEAQSWVAFGEAAKKLGFMWFDFLSAIDWMASPYGRYEDDGLSAPKSADPSLIETGYAGGTARFQAIARLVNLSTLADVIVKCDVGDDLVLPTWSGLYSGANWHEREVREMFGIDFEGHPNPRNMYLPGDFEGHPLRKDFPLVARMVKPWPGIVDVEPMPPSDEMAEVEDEVAVDGDEQ